MTYVKPYTDTVEDYFPDAAAMDPSPRSAWDQGTVPGKNSTMIEPFLYVKLNLNGRIFEIPGEVCVRIPLLVTQLAGKPDISVGGEGDIRGRVMTGLKARVSGDSKGEDGVVSDVTVTEAEEPADSATGEDCETDRQTGHPSSVPESLPGYGTRASNIHAGKPAPKPSGKPTAKSNPNLAGQQPETTLYFQRNATVFEAVLDFVQNGELHAPAHVCPKLFARDLLFWGFELVQLEVCCYPRVVSFLEEQDTVLRYHQASVPPLAEKEAGHHGELSWLQRCRRTVWTTITNPAASWAAKVYFVLLCLVILASFFVMAAGTTDTFTRPLTFSEWEEFLGEDDLDYLDYVDYFYDFAEHSSADQTMSSTTPDTTSTARGQTTKRFNPRTLVQWVKVSGYVWTACLTFDFLLRLLCCPSLRHFCLHALNVCDAIALVSTFAKYAIDWKFPEEKYEESHTDIINVLQLFRILRFLGPMSKMKGFRVVYFTLKTSLTELLMLFALLGFQVMIFSALLYYLGDRKSMPNIPIAMWYVLVTMTTVGYGDVVPHSFQTKLIGSVCAISGVLFLAMTLPIVVNNFFSLYTSCTVVPPSMTEDNQRKSAASADNKTKDKSCRMTTI